MNKETSVEDELYFLISHGIMHLFGFDHQTIEEYNFIVQVQNSALEGLKKKFGVKVSKYKAPDLPEHSEILLKVLDWH